VLYMLCRDQEISNSVLPYTVPGSGRLQGWWFYSVVAFAYVRGYAQGAIAQVY
jgi:hypothetical protein